MLAPSVQQYISTNRRSEYCSRRIKQVKWNSVTFCRIAAGGRWFESAGLGGGTPETTACRVSGAFSSEGVVGMRGTCR